MVPEKLTVLHISDLQCGEPFVPRAAEALLRLAPRIRPDVIVAAGTEKTLMMFTIHQIVRTRYATKGI